MYVTEIEQVINLSFVNISNKYIFIQTAAFSQRLFKFTQIE